MALEADHILPFAGNQEKLFQYSKTRWQNHHTWFDKLTMREPGGLQR
jgi:hypothetical protein